MKSKYEMLVSVKNHFRSFIQSRVHGNPLVAVLVYLLAWFRVGLYGKTLVAIVLVRLWFSLLFVCLRLCRILVIVCVTFMMNKI